MLITATFLCLTILPRLASIPRLKQCSGLSLLSSQACKSVIAPILILYQQYFYGSGGVCLFGLPKKKKKSHSTLFKILSKNVERVKTALISASDAATTPAPEN